MSDDGAPTQPEPRRPRLQLVGREGCHLCDDARELVTRVAKEEGVEWEELDFDAHPELPERFSELVPVVLVDGNQVSYWRIDESRVRGALRSSRGEQAAGSRGWKRWFGG